MSQTITIEGKNVLLVEDELFQIEEIANQLMALGAKDVLTATNLQDAKQCVQNGDAELAMLDVNLPEGQTTRELGEMLAARNVPVVFFSGLDVADSDNFSRDFEFLEKQLSLPRVKAALHRAMIRASSKNFGSSDTKMAGPEARQ